MKNFFQNKINNFNIFLFFYLFIGAYLSVNVGITHDEGHSNWVWELNKKKLYNIFFNTGYISKAPRFQNIFDYDNKLYNEIENEKVKAFEGGYSYRSSIFSLA